MRIDGILAAFVGIALVWEAVKLFVVFKYGATGLGGLRIEREIAPKRYWALAALHVLLWVFVLALFLSLLSSVLS